MSHPTIEAHDRARSRLVGLAIYVARLAAFGPVPPDALQELREAVNDLRTAETSVAALATGETQ